MVSTNPAMAKSIRDVAKMIAAPSTGNESSPLIDLSVSDHPRNNPGADFETLANSPGLSATAQRPTNSSRDDGNLINNNRIFSSFFQQEDQQTTDRNIIPSRQQQAPPTNLQRPPSRTLGATASTPGLLPIWIANSDRLPLELTGSADAPNSRIALPALAPFVTYLTTEISPIFSRASTELDRNGMFLPTSGYRQSQQPSALKVHLESQQALSAYLNTISAKLMSLLKIIPKSFHDEVIQELQALTTFLANVDSYSLAYPWTTVRDYTVATLYAYTQSHCFNTSILSAWDAIRWNVALGRNMQAESSSVANQRGHRPDNRHGSSSYNTADIRANGFAPMGFPHPSGTGPNADPQYWCNRCYMRGWGTRFCPVQECVTVRRPRTRSGGPINPASRNVRQRTNNNIPPARHYGSSSPARGRGNGTGATS